MNFRIIVEPSAEREIRESYRWISDQKSLALATRWFNSLQKKVQTLKSYPRRCPLAAENDRFPEEIRELLHGRGTHKHRVVFTIRDDEIHVIHVRHATRDEIEP